MSDIQFSKFDISAFQQRINKSDSLDAKRDLWASLAKSAEKCERYEDMCVFTSEIVSLVTGAGEDLSSEERNLLSVAYKNVIGARRQSWRTIVQDEQAEDRDDLQEFKQQLEDELVTISLDILAQLEDKLNPVAEKNSSNNDSKVFYLKMIGDYYRYLAESVYNRHESPAPFDPTVSDIDALKDQVKIVAGDLGADGFEKKYGMSADKIQAEGDTAAVQAMVKQCLRRVLDYAEQAKIFYEKAYDIATVELKPTHPIRLGLALNFSVCHYEILKNKKAACDLAKEAFDEAIAKLDNLEESDYKDSTLIMQLLRDNLTLWTSNDEGSEEDMGLEDVSGDEAV